MRLLLLMDVGGTMDPYYEPVSRLLTALHEDHGLREFQPYYFHNCVYDHLYTRARMTRADAIPTGDVLRKLDSRWKCVIVGDAAMHPAELLEPYGSIDPRLGAETQGIVWLHRIAEHFERSVWINPEDAPYWEGSHTARIIKRLFPMFHLSVDGLTAGHAGAGRRPQVGLGHGQARLASDRAPSSDYGFHRRTRPERPALLATQRPGAVQPPEPRMRIEDRCVAHRSASISGMAPAAAASEVDVPPDAGLDPVLLEVAMAGDLRRERHRVGERQATVEADR